MEEMHSFYEFMAALKDFRDYEMSVFCGDLHFLIGYNRFLLIRSCFCRIRMFSSLNFGAAHNQSANAENNADVEAIDQGRRAASTDERERLPRDGCDAHGHEHIKQGLDHEHQGCAHYR